MRRQAVFIIALIASIVLALSGCTACDCDPPGLTYLHTDGFAEVAQATYPNFDIEVCIENSGCRYIESLYNDRQVLTFWGLGESETTPEMPEFTVRFIADTTTTLTQDSFSIRTENVSGCCSGFHHVIGLEG